jgi:hypothetical protein
MATDLTKQPRRQYLDPPDAADQQFGGMQVELSPWVAPPEDAAWFNPAGSVAMPVNGLANRATVTQYHMPPGFAGVVKGLALVALQGGFNDFSGDVIFRLFRNTVPVENYENVPFQIGSLAQPAQTFIPLRPNQTLFVYVETYINPPTGLAAALLSGYKWPFTRQQSPLTRDLQ